MSHGHGSLVGAWPGGEGRWPVERSEPEAGTGGDVGPAAAHSLCQIRGIR